MTDLTTIQSWSRKQLEDAFSQVEDRLAKALEAEKLARDGFEKAAAERDQLKQRVESLMSVLELAAVLEIKALKEQVDSLVASHQICVGAAGIGDFSELCGWVDEKNQQVESQLGLDSPVHLTIPEILDRSASLQGFDRRRLRKRPTHISLHTIKERRESGAH